MSSKQGSIALKIINDFSRQLFLIKTPADFYQGLKDAFKNVLPDIDLFIVFRYNWEDNSFSVISSNYLKDIEDIQLDKKELESQLLKFINKNTDIHHADISKERHGSFLKLFNTLKSGSEMMVPLSPVNDVVGILYVYSPKENFFDGELSETVKLIGNMSSRTWNSVNYQALQIKSHKKAELEIVNQKNLMHEIFDYLPINVFTKDKEGKYNYLNKNAEESLGIKAKDAVGKTVYDIYPEITAKALEEDDKEVRLTKLPKISYHEVNVKGRPRHLFTGKKIIITRDNRELLIGFSVDITQNIQASKEIEDQKKFYRQIFNTVPNYIYIKDRNGKFILVNDAVSELFHISHEEILLKGIIVPTDVKTNIELNNSIDRKVLETGKSYEYEESVILKNGEERWYHTTKKPLPDKDGVVNILGISVDITERKKHSDELLKAKKTKEQFLANMSHEIRTPINGVVGMVNLLEEIPATEEQKKYLHAIKTSSKNLQVIINDILDLSAIESGNIKFEQIGFNLKSFFNTLISSFSYAAKQKGLSVTLNFDPYIDEVVIGDPVRLNQIISNLIGNAVKFTKRGHVKVYALKLAEENNVGSFQFIIDDSGIGIPDDKLQKVFENFEQGDDTVNRKYGGTGLGLAIVKQLVEAQSGSIEVQSKPGRGSKFTINLKFEIGNKTSDEDSSGLYNYESSGKELDLSGKKILLVEDNEVNMLYTRKILQNWKCSPDEAKNGLIALEKLKDRDYDMILMDVRMPIMDGFEATKFIRANFKPPKSTTPIIALTANAIKGDDEKCIDAGMNDYLSKPFQPETLKNKIISNMDLEGFTNKIPNRPKAVAAVTGKTVDLTYLREMSDNDTAFVKDMVKSFINQAPKDVENIWFHFENEEFDELANIIHKFKPSVTFMGIHELKETVPEIEEHCKQKKTELIQSRLKDFERICQRALSELKEEFPEL